MFKEIGSEAQHKITLDIYLIHVILIGVPEVSNFHYFKISEI